MTIAFPPDERVLLLKVSRGDKIAFRQLYEQVSPLLYAVALRLLKRREAAEEVVQEVFLTLWHAADQYDVGRGSVKTGCPPSRVTAVLIDYVASLRCILSKILMSWKRTSAMIHSIKHSAKKTWRYWPNALTP